MATKPPPKVSFFDLENEVKALAKQAKALQTRMRKYKLENTNATGKFTGHPPREPAGSPSGGG